MHEAKPEQPKTVQLGSSELTDRPTDRPSGRETE